MGKVTRKRYGSDFSAGSSEPSGAIGPSRWRTGELTLAELAAKHGIHQTQIAAWKKQEIEGMAAIF